MLSKDISSELVVTGSTVGCVSGSGTASWVAGSEGVTGSEGVGGVTGVVSGSTGGLLALSRAYFSLRASSSSTLRISSRLMTPHSTLLSGDWVGAVVSGAAGWAVCG